MGNSRFSGREQSYFAVLKLACVTNSFYYRDSHSAPYLGLGVSLKPGNLLSGLNLYDLVGCMVAALDAPDLVERLDGLWNKFALNNSAVSRELEPLLKLFTYDLIAVVDEKIAYAKFSKALKKACGSKCKKIKLAQYL